MKHVAFVALTLAAMLSGCAAADNAVTTACADVSDLQSALTAAVAILGPNAAIVQAGYAVVETACMTAPQVEQWVGNLETAIAAAKKAAAKE